MSDQDDLHAYLVALKRIGPPDDIEADIRTMRAYLVVFRALGKPEELQKDIEVVKEIRKGVEYRRRTIEITRTTAIYFSAIMGAWLLFRENILEWFRGGGQ